jgi:hypothetical protein
MRVGAPPAAHKVTNLQEIIDRLGVSFNALSNLKTSDGQSAPDRETIATLARGGAARLGTIINLHEVLVENFSDRFSFSSLPLDGRTEFVFEYQPLDAPPIERVEKLQARIWEIVKGAMALSSQERKQILSDIEAAAKLIRP